MHRSVPEDQEVNAVHMIEVWFSVRRERWIVERVTLEGRIVGPVFSTVTEVEALECSDAWARAHPDAYLSRSDISSGKAVPTRVNRQAA